VLALSRTLGAGALAPVPLRGIPDSTCARCSVYPQVGTKGCRFQSNKGMGLGCGRLIVIGVKRNLSLQQNACDIEEPISDTANGPTMRAATLAQRSVTTAAFGVVLNRDAGPVVDGVTESSVGPIPHDNDTRFAAPLGHGCDARQCSQRRIVASAERSRSLGKQRREVDPTYPGNDLRIATSFCSGPSNTKHSSSSFLSAARSSSFAS
jgi:hypothetical protein